LGRIVIVIVVSPIFFKFANRHKANNRGSSYARRATAGIGSFQYFFGAAPYKDVHHHTYEIDPGCLQRAVVLTEIFLIPFVRYSRLLANH